MNQFIKRSLLVSGVVMAALTSAHAFDAKAPVVLPMESQVFESINPMIAMAGAWGDRATGQHGSFGTFEPEFMTPFHTHTGAYHGVVIEGVMTNPFDGEADPPEMGPGSYWYVPAGAVHATACISDTPCRFYFHADEGFDFVMHE